MANGPMVRVVLRSREKNEDEKYDYVPIFAGWRRDGDDGKPWISYQLDGAVERVTIELKGKGGEPGEVVELAAGEESDWYPSIYDDRRKGNGGAQGRQDARGERGGRNGGGERRGGFQGRGGRRNGRGGDPPPMDRQRRASGEREDGGDGW